MKKICNFIIPIIILLTNNSYTQYETFNTGIMPFVNMDNNKPTDAAVSELTSYLSEYKFINLIERSKLKSILKETSLGMSGVVNEDTAVKSGKIQGISIMIFGAVQKNIISARAVYTQTGKIIASYSIYKKSKIDLLAKKIASGIETFIAKENIKNLRNDSPNIKLNFWVEQKTKSRTQPKNTNTMKIGENAIFNFSSNRNGYLTIVDIQSSGDVIILFPNDFSQNNSIIAKKNYSIPSIENDFELKVSEPAGIDTVVAFFTEKKVNWLDRQMLTGHGFWSVKEGKKIYITRGFKIIATGLNKLKWESSVLKIKVIK